MNSSIYLSPVPKCRKMKPKDKFWQSKLMQVQLFLCCKYWENYPQSGPRLPKQCQCSHPSQAQAQDAVWLISRHWNWGILSIKTARPPAVKEQTVKVSQFLRACKVQTVILWISAIGNFNIIRSQRACKEQTTIQWISAIGNLNRYVDIMGCCPCVRWGELCV